MAAGFMPHLPAEPTRASRLRPPVRRAHRVESISSAPTVSVSASVDPAERQEPTGASTARPPRGKRAGHSDPAEARVKPFLEGLAVARPSQLGVRRPRMTSMPADRREQAISALAHLLIAQ